MHVIDMHLIKGHLLTYLLYETPTRSVKAFSHNTPTSHTDRQTHNLKDQPNRYHDGRLKRKLIIVLGQKRLME